MRVLEKFIQADDSLRAEKQLDLTYRRIKIVFWATVSVSAMLVAALWSIVDHGTLLIWWFSQAAVMAARVVLLRRHYQKKNHVVHWKWKAEYAIGSAIAGLNWGITLFIFHLGLHEPTTLFLILVIFALGAYGSVSMASVLSSAVAFLLPLLLPLAVWLFPFDHFLGTSALIYLGLMLLMARQVHKVILAAHLTTIENEAQALALRESGQRMANYFENAPGFFFTLLRKPDGDISMPFASTGITTLFGLKPDELTDNVAALAALYNPEDREKVFAEMQRSGQALTPCRVMFRANHPEKGEIWVEARSVPQQDADGNIRWNGFMQDITEQKQAEVLLQKREREFRALAENAPDPIYRYDRNCRRVYINKAVEQMTGVPLSRIWGKSPTEAMPNPSVDAVKAEQAIRRVLDTGKPGELEVSFVAADGRDTTVHNLLVPEFAEDGSVESVLCIGRDVTAHKYMTEVLTKSERSFRTLAENATDNIARHDSQCRFVYLNPNFETMLGLSTGFLLHKTPAEVFSDGMLDDYEEVMKQVIASGQAADHYLMLPGERYHHVRLTPERNDNGEVSGVLAIGRDITELKRMEQALHKSEEKHRTVFESANDAIFLHRIVERNGNTEFILHDLNQKGCELWGHSRKDILSGNFDLLAPNNPPYSFEEATRRNLLAAAGEPQLFEWEHKRADGSKVLGEVNLRRIEIGGEAFLLAVTRDITERKQAEENNRSLQRQLQMIADNTPGAVNCYRMFMDGSGKMLYANKGMYDVFGFTLQDLADDITPMASRMHPDDLPCAIEIMTEAARTQSTMKSEFRVNHPEKGEIWVQQISTPVYESEDSMLWYGLMFDISERKRMEQALLRREEEFRTLAENIPDIIIRYDRDCRRVYINNPALLTMEGELQDKLIGNSPATYTPLLDPERYLAELRKVMQSGAASMLEVAMRGAHGATMWYTASFVPEFDSNGNVSGVLMVARDITERKRMEKALASREREFSSLADNLPDPVFRYAVDGRRIYVNPAVVRISGIPAEKLLEHTPQDAKLVSSNDGGKVQDVIRKVVETGLPHDVEVMHVTQSGELRTYINRHVPEFGLNGEVVCVLSVGRDITEQKRLSDSLQESQARYRQIFDNSQEGLYLFDVTEDERFRMIEVNPAFERLVGIPREGMVGKFHEEILPGEMGEKVAAKYRRCLAAGTVYEEELELELPAGSLIYFSTLVPVRNEAGRIVRIVGITRDITERRRMEDLLRQREEMFRTLVESAPDPIFRYDRELRRTYVNPAVLRITGQAESVLKGETLASTPIAAKAENERLQRDIRLVLETGQPHEGEIEYTAPDGRYYYFLNRFGPEFNKDGEVAGVVSIMRDITGQKLAQRALIQREQEFRALSENSPDTIMRYDLECRRIYVNPAFIQLIGLPAEDLLGGTPTQYSSAPQALAYENALRRVLQSGEPGEHEYTWPAKGGKEIISYFRLIPEWDGDGKLMSVLAVGRDITEYKKAETALQKNFQRLTEFHRHLEVQTTELQASQEQLKQTLEFSEGVINAIPDILFEMDCAGRYHNVWTQNPDVQAAQKAMLVGKTVHELLSPEAAEAAMDAIREADRNGVAYGKVIAIVQSDGETRWYEHSLAKKHGSENSDTRFIALSRDITARKQMEEALMRREQELRTLVDNSPDTIARYDRDCRRTYVNPLFASLVDGGAAALLGKTPKECPGGANTDMYESKLKEVFATGENGEFELQWADHDGREICSHIRLAAERDAAGNVISVLAVGRDISELNAHRKRIYQMAFYDTLTSLPNRALFNDRLKQMLTDASRHGQQTGVMLLDLDRFKAVNDTLGHAAGDELLREAAGRLAYCVRGYDTVARLSGDEFAILLPEVRSGDDLGRVARKILESFNEPFILDGHELFISCSIGIAVYPSDGDNAEDLLKRADSAMYFAKHSGRNTFRFFSTDLMDSANERLALEAELRRGFVRGELELYYQPKVSLCDGAIIGSEALLRWHHPQRGMVPPDKFIPIAEDCGLIVEIGEWVLRNACRTACQWNGAGKPLHKVAINLSARQFQSINLVKTVRRLLTETACQPEWVELEITESLLLDEDGAVLEMLNAFREMGITIAIDDFGTGYSSLSYLARFPIDTLKIDRSFTSRITKQSHHAELVKAIISIALSLNQKVVAEGVETEEEADFLQSHGCHIAQGYLYSKPVAKTVFEMLPLSFGRVEVDG